MSSPVSSMPITASGTTITPGIRRRAFVSVSRNPFPDGRAIRIDAHRRHTGTFYNQVALNGTAHNRLFLPRAELLKNARVVFSLTES